MENLNSLQRLPHTPLDSFPEPSLTPTIPPIQEVKKGMSELNVFFVLIFVDVFFSRDALRIKRKITHQGTSSIRLLMRDHLRRRRSEIRGEGGGILS